MNFKIAQCAGCGADIIWIVTPLGRRAPVNAQPVHGFPIRVDRDGEHPHGESPVTVYVSHFATCPNADQFRRKPNGPTRAAGRDRRPVDAERAATQGTQPRNSGDGA